MCEFFSFVGDGFGNYKYLDWDFRKNHLNENCDSHTFILTHFNVPPKMQDRWSKYEYNPLTKKFTVDEPVEGHDHNSAESWVNALDFASIVAPLNVKPIVNPWAKTRKPTKNDIVFLAQWASVWASVRDSVRASVMASVGASVMDSVMASVRDSVMASVWASVMAYTGSFFDIGYKIDIASSNNLWDRGFVPSFDGKVWRLHSGKKAKIVLEITKEELDKYRVAK